MNTGATNQRILLGMDFYIIPCSAAKLDTPAKARDLYAGAMFRHTLAAAEACVAATGGQILILSALLGLVDLETVLTPYCQKMGLAGSIDAAELSRQAAARGIDWQDNVYALLPFIYFRTLDDALRPLDVYAHDVYEVNSGIGDQRAINSCIVRSSTN